MAGVDAADLWACADEYLNACIVALGDTPDGPPGRQFVSPGVPPWDCEQVCVHVGGPSIGDTYPLIPALAPGHRAAVQGMVNLVSLTATIIRCAPVMGENGELPAVAALDAASQQTTADLWAIWCHVARAKRNGTLFAPKEREFYLDPAVSLNQQGGFSGWQITIRTQLDGYVPGT